MKYSISRNGQVLGSYTEEEVRSYVQAGRLIATDYALPEGGSQWIPLGQLSFGASALAAPPGGAPTAAASAMIPPKTHLALAITGTALSLFSCSIFATPIGLGLGIPAIVFASKVNGRFSAGDHAGAASASKNAAIFGWISLGVAILGILFAVVVFAIMLASGMKR